MVNRYYITEKKRLQSMLHQTFTSIGGLKNLYLFYDNGVTSILVKGEGVLEGSRGKLERETERELGENDRFQLVTRRRAVIFNRRKRSLKILTLVYHT